MARVEVYCNLLCPFCYRAKKLLESKGVAFEEIDVMLGDEPSWAGSPAVLRVDFRAVRAGVAGGNGSAVTSS